jgi:hypothetical protein
LVAPVPVALQIKLAVVESNVNLLTVTWLTPPAPPPVLSLAISVADQLPEPSSVSNVISPPVMVDGRFSCRTMVENAEMLLSVRAVCAVVAEVQDAVTAVAALLVEGMPV